MQIRIVTFFKERNCGAVLQAYALTKYLEKTGNIVEILNYDPFYGKKYGTANIVKRIILSGVHFIQNCKFKNFRNKNLNLSEKIISAEEIHRLPSCDLYITGSDQVWNPYLTDGYDDIFFLNFITDAKKMSYSASYGREDFSEEYLNTIKRFIKDYLAVSVRESSFCEVLTDAGIKANYTVDPVFLFDKAFYKAIERKSKYSNYCLIYTKSETDDIWEYARIIAEKRNLKIIDTSKIKKMPGVYKTNPLIDPYDFLGLIDGADIVLTNSFHGTAFSIIYNKEFYCMSAGDANARLVSLLSHTGLTNRMISGKSFEIKTIDYNYANKRIKEFAESSKEYLASSLKAVKREKSK